ncbi:MAG: YidC/Oxa1 family membrane protein insertase [Lachnospiraceae bacterium]|nr:YidC/Oxa1 family membrane protein insertase [Lachnospiraceae bacterium]
MGTLLYRLILLPLIFLLEIIFVLMYRLIGNPGAVLPLLSLVVSLLTLPLYRRAEAMQEEERARVLAMEPFIAHIKESFAGSERRMIMDTYYRQQSYTPLKSLRSTLSLLLQVPFFMAAYLYLSGLDTLQGASFLFLQDLGAPDKLLTIGNTQLNLLPILMTLLNVLSGMVYTKGFPLREKLQTYGLALLFLVLLYNSPAGLVLYWTCNQIFSLLKNLLSLRKKEKVGGDNDAAPSQDRQRGVLLLFLAGAVFLTLLTGLLIPSAPVADEPLAFVPAVAFYHPLRLILATVCVAAGVFLFWGGVVYYTGSAKTHRRIASLYAVLSVLFTVNYMVFGRNAGVLTADLIYEEAPFFSATEVILNLLLMAALAAVVLLLIRKLPVFLRYALPVLCLAVTVLGVMNLFTVSRVVGESRAERDEDTVASLYEEDGSVREILALSSTKQNVVVIMLDRAIGAYVPFLLQENPALAETFSGFTFYPNTLSHGSYTIFGAPELFGGYEYTVDAMNERADVPLVEKHNEALKVLPRLFSENGYDVTVCDPPYAGYRWKPDLSIYDGLAGVKAYVTEGMLPDIVTGYEAPDSMESRGRNLFFYGLCKASPLVLQPALYDEGHYLSSPTREGYPRQFMESFNVLTQLISLTRADAALPGQLILLQNASTHEPVELQKPEYLPSLHTDNSAFPQEERVTLPDGNTMLMQNSVHINHYHVNMAALLQLGKWLDYLKDAGVYDNTRIIITSDHGRHVGQFPALIVDNKWDAARANPLLLVKDFGDDGALTISEEFMTIADVPVLATEDVIENPVNPYTGKTLSSKEKDAHRQRVHTSHRWDPAYHGETVFDLSDGVWYSVEGDIRVKENWVRE